MKITIEIPDNTLVLTYQYVLDHDERGVMSISQRILDSKALNENREGQKNAKDT